MKKGFTLVELIVVIAIIAILSTVGFVSYTGYIRDSRNSVRQSDLAEAVNVITQFIATEGRAPKCAGTSSVCYFSPSRAQVGNVGDANYKSAYTLEKDKATAASITWADATSPTTAGIAGDDWDKLNVRKAPEDPKKVYYLYAVNGDKFAVFAVKEDPQGYSTLVQGSNSFDSNMDQLGVTVTGWPVVTGAIDTDGTPAPSEITKNLDTTHVPYNPTAS